MIYSQNWITGVLIYSTIARAWCNTHFYVPINSKLSSPRVLQQEILQAALAVHSIANSEASVVHFSATICRSDNTSCVLLVWSCITRHRHCDRLLLQRNDQLLRLVALNTHVVFNCRNNN